MGPLGPGTGIRKYRWCHARALFGNNARTVRARESSSDYWTSLGALTDQTRYILAKRPGFSERRNLEQQRRSLEEGVAFCWLVYDTPAAREQWARYLGDLRSLGVAEGRLRSQLQGRVIPAALRARGIDWRISIFGDQIALCSYEPDDPAARTGAQTFTLDAPAELREKFTTLFDACPAIDGPDPPADPGALDRARSAHTALKTAFLRSFREGLPTDIMLHRLEEASASSDVLLGQTRLLIWISVATLVAVVVALVLTQVQLP